MSREVFFWLIGSRTLLPHWESLLHGAGTGMRSRYRYRLRPLDHTFGDCNSRCLSSRGALNVVCRSRGGNANRFWLIDCSGMAVRFKLFQLHEGTHLLRQTSARVWASSALLAPMRFSKQVSHVTRAVDSRKLHNISA